MLLGSPLNMNIVASIMTHNYNLGPIAGDNLRLKNILSSYSGNLNIGHINAQSLCPSNSNAKLEEFKSNFMDSGLDIIGVSETWFKPDLISQSLSLPGYNLVRNDRPGDRNINSHAKRAGGVCLYISKSLRYRVLFRGNRYGVCESLFVEIFGSGPSVIVGVVYLPNGCVDTFEDLHSDLFDRFSNIIIMGDFNYNLFDSVKSNYFRSLVSRCGLSFVHNCLPTHLHVPNNATSLLDYFIFSQPSLLAHKGQLQFPFFSSHHSFIYVSVMFTSHHHANCTEHKDYNRINLDEMYAFLSQFEGSQMFFTNDVDSQLSILNNLVENLHFLVPTSRIRSGFDYNWMMSDKVIMARRERDLAYGAYLRNRTDLNWRSYCRLRNKAKSVIRKARYKYGKKLFAGVNTCQMWSRIRNLGCIGRENCELDENDIETIATIFLNNLNPGEHDEFNFDNFIDNHNSFSFERVTEYDLLLAVNSITTNAAGHDNIPIKFIKIIFPLICPLLLHLVNTIFTVSKFPAVWKLGRVVPIAKNGRFDNENLRPISILPAMSKILENLMKFQILSYCDRFSLFHTNQYAFRKNHSTTSLLLSLTDDIRKDLDNRSDCVMVSLDLTKAFDRINHVILIRKLKDRFNFSKSACRLIYSYLLDRLQYVSYNNFNSSIGAVTSGVPQGSVLGPILFLAYLNDGIELMNNNFCSSYVFADDIMLLYSACPENNMDLENCINNHLSSISDWMHSNQLQINSAKSKAINFQTRNIVPPNIVLNGQLVDFVDSLKCLGVIVDSNLNFNCHIDSVSNRICHILRRLYSLKAYTPIHVRIRLAHSLLMSQINYCIEVFSGTWTYNLHRIERIVRKVVRYVFNVRIHEHDLVTERTPAFLGCSFHDYLNIRILLHFYKVMKVRQPESLVNKFSFIHSTRNIQIDIPLIHLSVFEHSFLVRVYRVWNRLPTTLKLFSYSYLTFRKKLMDYFNGIVSL